MTCADEKVNINYVIKYIQLKRPTSDKGTGNVVLYSAYTWKLTSPRR